MFEINQKLHIIEEKFEDSTFLLIDNIFKHPHLIVDWLKHNEPKNLWKYDQEPSYNGKYFVDKRHNIQHYSLDKFFLLIESLTNRTLRDREVYSNYIIFKDKNFNDYKNNYWFPHVDFGYNAIVYLNEFDCDGTNIYYNDTCDTYMGPEHFESWRPKNLYRLKYTSKATFNRLFIFDGELPHGMAINTDAFFVTHRLNLVTFSV